MHQDDENSDAPLVERNKRNHNNKKDRTDSGAVRANRIRRKNLLEDSDDDDDWREYQSR